MYDLKKYAGQAAQHRRGWRQEHYQKSWFWSPPSRMPSPGLGADSKRATLPFHQHCYPSTSRDRRIPSQALGTSVRSSISLNSKFCKSHNHRHLIPKLFPKAPLAHVTFNSHIINISLQNWIKQRFFLLLFVMSKRSCKIGKGLFVFVFILILVN